ncbi:MAG: hypothetical protein ACYC27_19815 [Armatimonadota bacterium]
MELSNGIVRFLFDDETGNLSQITDIHADRDYLHDASGNRLLDIFLMEPDYTGHPVCSYESGKPLIGKLNDSVTITFPELLVEGKPTGISADVTVHLPAEKHEAIFTVEIRNDSPHTISEVHCPVVGGWTGIAGQGKDIMTVAGWQIDPHTAFPTHRSHTFGRKNMRRYFQGPYFLPFADLSGDGYGLSYCIYADAPRINGILVEDLSPYYNRTCLSWTYVGEAFIKPGAVWKSPDIGVGIHRGDWHDTVDRFRESIEGWWKPAPVPSRLRESIGFHNIQFTGFNGEFYHDLAELPEIIRDCQRYGINDLCLWDIYAQVYLRPDTGGVWEMEPERLDALRRGLQEAKRMGCNTSTLVNFRLITERSRLFNELEPEVQKSYYGYPLSGETYPCSVYAAKWINPNLEAGGRILCQTSLKFKNFALGLVKETLDLGFTSLFIDQATDWNCCFDPNHGHASPDDTIEKAYEWAAEAVDIVRSRDRDAYVIGELPEVFNTPIIDLWWDWDRRTRKAEVIRYLLPQSLQAYIVDENETDVIGPAFAMGHIFALMTHNLGGLLSDEPEFAAHITRLSNLRTDTLPYLAYGTFRDNKGISADGGSAYSYISDAGIAVGLGNSKDHSVRMKIKLDPKVLGREPLSGGKVHIEDGTVLEISPAGIDGTLLAEVELPKFGAAVWCIPCR